MTMNKDQEFNVQVTVNTPRPSIKLIAAMWALTIIPYLIVWFTIRFPDEHPLFNTFLLMIPGVLSFICAIILVLRANKIDKINGWIKIALDITGAAFGIAVG